MKLIPSIIIKYRQSKIKKRDLKQRNSNIHEACAVMLSFDLRCDALKLNDYCAGHDSVCNANDGILSACKEGVNRNETQTQKLTLISKANTT